MNRKSLENITLFFHSAPPNWSRVLVDIIPIKKYSLKVKELNYTTIEKMLA
jgi:hypothetical protein